MQKQKSKTKLILLVLTGIVVAFGIITIANLTIKGIIIAKNFINNPLGDILTYVDVNYPKKNAIRVVVYDVTTENVREVTVEIDGWRDEENSTLYWYQVVSGRVKINSIKEYYKNKMLLPVTDLTYQIDKALDELCKTKNRMKKDSLENGEKIRVIEDRINYLIGKL